MNLESGGACRAIEFTATLTAALKVSRWVSPDIQVPMSTDAPAAPTPQAPWPQISRSSYALLAGEAIFFLLAVLCQCRSPPERKLRVLPDADTGCPILRGRQKPMEATGDPTGSHWINLSNCRAFNSGSCVYVIYAAMGDDKIPFYVGESATIFSRLGEYARASFKAPTDFKVGRTIRLLEKKGYEILVEIELTSNRGGREKELIGAVSPEG